MVHTNAPPFAGPSEFSAAIPGTPQPTAGAATPAPGGRSPGMSRPTLMYLRRERSRKARRRRRWMTRIEAMIPELDRQHHPIRHDIDGGDVQEALDVAIADVCMRMTPLSPEEREDRMNKEYTLPPLAVDVALGCGGRILAVVFATPNGPVVHRFFPSIPTKR